MITEENGKIPTYIIGAGSKTSVPANPVALI